MDKKVVTKIDGHLSNAIIFIILGLSIFVMLVKTIVELQTIDALSIYLIALFFLLSIPFTLIGLFFLLVRLELYEDRIVQINPVFRRSKTVVFDDIRAFAILKAGRGTNYFLRTINRKGKRVNIVFDNKELREVFLREMKERGLEEEVYQGGFLSPPYRRPK